MQAATLKKYAHANVIGFLEYLADEVIAYDKSVLTIFPDELEDPAVNLPNWANILQDELFEGESLASRCVGNGGQLPSVVFQVSRSLADLLFTKRASTLRIAPIMERNKACRFELFGETTH